MYVSDEEAEQHTFTSGGVPISINPNGTYSTSGMYVQEFRPRTPRAAAPVLFMHGGSMSGAVWEHTPDGRDGWLQHFIRAGIRCYNVDAVERGRSGWNPRDAHFRQRPILRTAEDCFHQFRLGAPVHDTQSATLKSAAHPGLRFPLQYFDQFTAGIVPRWTDTDDVIMGAYRQLIERIGRVTLCAHSQGAAFAFQLAERCPDLVESIIAVEPARAGDGDGSSFTGVDVLAIYGDFIELDSRWPAIRRITDAYFATASSNGADITVRDLPLDGVRGNSHLLLIEDNNAAIAGIALDWLDTR